MMRAIRWVSLLAVGLALQPIVSRELVSAKAKQPYGVWGAGNTNCGKMMDNIRRDRRSWGDDFYANYATGFITGANFRSFQTGRVKNAAGMQTSNEALIGALEQYCAGHPLDTVTDALVNMYGQLAVR